MERRPWTVAEEQALRRLAPLGANQLAEIFNRTTSAIRKKCSRLEISVKKDPQSHVTDLSQPVIDYIRRYESGLLCTCGKRFVAVKRTGLCGVCHLEYLKARHDEAYAELAATRTAKQDYDTSKQQLRRLREEMGVTPGRKR